MARSFNGRQSEELYNEELYKLFEVIKNIVDVPIDPSIGPATTREGALWLDRQAGDLKYFKEGMWQLLFEKRFRTVNEILSPAQPENPVPGQLWLDDGMLMYYNGAEWLPVKSVNVDTEFNISSFEQFLIISPIQANGNQVVEYVDMNGNGVPDTAVYKSQFLMPSVDMDKFFINGTFTNDYERVSNVAIQYPSDQLQGKVASAVHVNPSKLVGITKKLIVIDKLNPIIAIPELNTEYYGFKGGTGHLLLKTNDASTEYVSVPQGIQLSPLAAAMYDYVMTITYQFKDIKQEGHFSKGKVSLNGSNSVYIGYMTDFFNVFVQGMYLDEDSENYTYDSQKGFLNINLETRLDIGVIAFHKKEKGTITTVDEQNRGIVTMNSTFNKPIVFVYGESLRGIADYVQGTGDDSNKLFVVDALPGMKYSIVETMGETDDTKMYVKDGVATGNTISCSFDEIPGDTNPILFLNGLLVSQKDIVRDATDGSITCYGMVAGMDYILLKDPASRLVFNDTVSFTTIPTDSMDDAIVYVENQLICDSSTVYVTKLPEGGTIGEVRLLLSNGTEQWYRYEMTTGWTPIVDPEAIDNLNATSLGYSTSRKSISILQNFGPVDCVYFSYSFANSVEEPLLRGNIVTNNTESEYKIAFNHNYPVGTNALSVWLDGIRQYPNRNIDLSNPDGIVEVDSARFRLPEPIAGNLFYVIERPEKSETKACQRQVLTLEDRVEGTINVYQTSIPLYPGNVRVFIGGLRQPSTAYKIIDSYTLMIKDPVIGSANNFPVETVEVDGRIVNITHSVYDKILVEVRQDYNLREITLPVRYAGQKEWNIAAINSSDLRTGGDGLPKTILDSKDFIMIYINGLAYGKEYTIDKDNGSIILTNEEVTSCLGVDYLDRYFKNNPEAYLDWQRRHNYAEYVPNPITDKITFEWR